MKPHGHLTDTWQFFQGGGWQVLNQYPGRDHLYSTVRNAILGGVEKIAGLEAVANLESSGLEKLHLVVPGERILELGQMIKKTIREDCYKWSYQMGREYFGFDGDFIIDANVVIRLHLPEHVAEKIQIPEDIEYEQKYGNTAARKLESRYAHYDASMYDYNRHAAILSWCHGAHRDCWYGNSLGGVNLWVAIAGVSDESGMVFYPETVHKSAVYDVNTMLNGEGWKAPRPVRVFGGAGDLIAFNGDMVHSSICNTSEDTRIAITCRLNAEAPIFINEAYWHITSWLRSQDVESGDLQPIDFPDVTAACPDVGVDIKPGQRQADIKIDADFPRDRVVRVVPSVNMPEGARYLVRFKNGQLILGRGHKGLFAMGSNCPHRGLSLADGYMDEDDTVWCPGHGLRFDPHSGKCAAKRYRIAAHTTIEADGWISIGPRKNTSAVLAAESP